ncbi:MAG: Type 1 glutamine amidotransferase-like domain-containing protein [Lachnospiraceae bacterium]|nr:Type 1 glutamine amidotransferase-like domain-containing protein [Lachnospiraceae bacterium]
MKLLLGLKQSDAFQKIKEYILNDGIVIGGSAGAVIFGKDIDIISSMDSNDVNLTDTAGFNVLSGISIFPHYTNKKSSLNDIESEQRHNRFTNAIKDFSLKKAA